MVTESTQELLSARLMRNNARLRVLAEVSNSFAAVSTDYRELLDKIAFTATDLIGDACMVTLVEDGMLVNSASAHRDSKLQEVYRSYLSHLKVSPVTSNSVSAQVVRSGKPMFANVDPLEMAERADENLKPLVKQLNIHSYAVVPIHVRGQIIGTISMSRGVPGRSYGKDDVILLQDIAARAGLAIENVRLYMQLESKVLARTQDLEMVNKELESFSYSVAHDLRAPLRSIDGYSQTVLNDYSEKLDETAKGFLQKISDSAKRMNRLIEDMLKLSQVTRLELVKQTVDLSSMVDDIVTELREQTPERQIKIKIQGRVSAFGDHNLLEIALTNLLSNAWKFTRYAKDPYIEFGAFRRMGETVYYVKDSGAGFDPSHAEKLFQAFERLHNANEFEGTGIGLAIVNRIIQRHGGEIWAESEIGKGAIFYFTL